MSDSLMLFSQEAQDAFWSEMHPDTRACFEIYEAREQFTYKLDELPDLFFTVAGALPDVASLPIESKNQDVLISLIPLLASMPLRQSIFAIHWLNDQAKESPIGWGTLCYLEALNIVNNIKQHPNHDLAGALVDRVMAVMRLRKAMGLYAQWPLKTGE